MWAHRYRTMVVLATLALRISVQAQECSSSTGWKPIHLEWPFTAEYHLHEYHQDRPEADRDYVLVMASDSQGRLLSDYKFADGQSSSHVFDPVVAQQIWWGTGSAKAKIVKYPTPVQDRSSCWRSPWPERSSTTGRTSSTEYKSKCGPAGPPVGQGQSVDCRDACYIELWPKLYRLRKKDFRSATPHREGPPKILA